MATAAPPVSSTKETTNYARLCRLLVDVGTQALRDTFDTIYPPANLHAILSATKTTLQSLRTKKVINATQWGKLFPAIPTSVSSAHFDITLLMVLLRNVCGLPSPAAGWDTLPAVTDVSREADVARVKYYRNTVYGHAECASVDDSMFNACWGDIRDTLVRLGGMKYKAAIDNLETECMDPEAEDHYKEALSQWKKDEDSVKDKLDEVIKKLDDLTSSSLPQSKESAIEGKSTVLEELSDPALCRERGHETETLDHYCKNCKVRVCDKCGRTRHTHHTKVNIQQATEEEKLKMEEIVEQVKLRIVDLEMQMKTTTELLTISKEKITAARKDVWTTVEELIRELKKHERAMVTQLDFIEKEQQRDHSTQLEHLQASVNELKSSVLTCEEILHKKVSIETLQAQQAEIERCRGILQAPKKDIYKTCQLRYQINEEYHKSLTGSAPGELIVSKTDPLRSCLKWDDWRRWEAGKKQSFEVELNSSDKNFWHRNINNIDEIKVKVHSPTGVDYELECNFAFLGSHCFAFRPLCDGEHEVTASVNDQPLPGTPLRLLVAPHQYNRIIKHQPRRKTQFKEPCAVAIDTKTGNWAVADRKKQRVQIFSFLGYDLNKLGQSEPVLKEPTSVAFTQSGDVIVISAGAMFLFTTNGKFIEKVSNKHLKDPFSVTFASDGRMVVCDSSDKSVKVLSPDGTELLQSFRAPDSEDSPWEAVCHQDMFFVSYPTATCVKTFNKDGDFLYDIGKENRGEGRLSKPRGLAVDAFGSLIVCDEENKSLSFFKLTGTFLKMIRSDRWDCPWSIAVSPSTLSAWFIVADPNTKSVIICE